MKPIEPINRDRLLEVIGKRLRESAANREALERTVRKIMDSVSPEDRPLQALNEEVATRAPVPLGDVAAFVDGTIADVQTERRITTEAIEDEGLLLEIVMAIKSKMERQTESEAPLPSGLRSRLLEMGGSLKGPATEPDPLDAVLPHTEAPPIDAVEPGSSVERIEIRAVEAKSHRQRQKQHARPSRLPRAPIVLVTLAVAAVLLLFVSWRSFSIDEESKTIAEDSDVTPSVTPLPPDSDSTPGPSMVVEDSSPLDDNSAPAPTPEPESVREPDPMARPAPEPMIVDATPEPTSDPPTPRPINSGTPKPLFAKWNQIDGLLLQSDSPRVVNAMSLASPSKPKSVPTGTELTFVSTSAESRLRLETLPLCRAEAELDGGGTLVVADDTRIEMTRGGAIDLRYGAIALMDVGRKTMIRIGSSLRTGIPVFSPEGASVVVRRTTSGMEFDVKDQPVRIGEETFINKTVRVDSETQQATALDDAPARLPRWTRERTQRIELGRTILAQLSTSEDVGGSIQQLIQSGSVRGESSMLLRNWFVASRRDYLMRLIASDDGLIRESALTYLRETRPNDPRHGELWRMLRAKSQNARQFALVRSLFADYWAGQRPASNRRDGLVMMLAANDPSVRATGDFLLRTFYGKGPPFIMNANTRTQQRVIGNWRVIINRIEGN
ncbi:MAG: hypothetical protein AAFX06_15790 [Planctomycetota bacterium]